SPSQRGSHALDRPHHEGDPVRSQSGSSSLPTLQRKPALRTTYDPPREEDRRSGSPGIGAGSGVAGIPISLKLLKSGGETLSSARSRQLSWRSFAVQLIDG